MVYRNYLIFHLPLLFITPTHVLGLTLAELTSKTTIAAVSGVTVRQIRIRRQLLSYALALMTAPRIKGEPLETQYHHQRGVRERRRRLRTGWWGDGWGAGERSSDATEDWGVTWSNAAACAQGQLNSVPVSILNPPHSPEFRTQVTDVVMKKWKEDRHAESRRRSNELTKLPSWAVWSSEYQGWVNLNVKWLWVRPAFLTWWFSSCFYEDAASLAASWF